MTQENESQHSEDLSASSAFAESLAGQVNQHDVDCMIQAQKHMMLRFEKTNEMLINCNALSTIRFHSACQEFKRHTQLLVDMKKDLDVVFRRVRNLKLKLSSQYPQAFQACSTVHKVLDEKEEDAENEIPSTSKEEKESEPSQPEKQEDSTVYPKMNNSSSCSQTTTPSPTTSSSSD